ncbi:MAG: phosphatase domain-containing protein [Phycisphaerae bacterium]|nr:phosphatase domain-containing protein [Phycisphaerae bacterium]
MVECAESNGPLLDTIKVSEVLNRDRLLAHTFLEPFTAFKGMADVYAMWSARGAVFHYVSSSPFDDPATLLVIEAKPSLVPAPSASH